jgi:hypothetical protein
MIPEADRFPGDFGEFATNHGRQGSAAAANPLFPT